MIAQFERTWKKDEKAYEFKLSHVLSYILMLCTYNWNLPYGISESKTYFEKKIVEHFLPLITVGKINLTN